MIFNLLPLFVILVVSLMIRNSTISIAALVLLAIKIIPMGHRVLPLIEKKGLSIGVTVLTMAVLAPLATGKINTSMIIEAFKTPRGIFAILTGVFVAWIAGQGMPLMVSSPEVIVALMIGTVMGVCFLKGLAVGPLIAAGFVAVLAKMMRL